MIITKTPFRISFFGGGTDYPIWYENNGGAVLSTTIDKYCYLTCRYLPPFFPHKTRVVYSDMEFVNRADDIKHPVVREAIKHLAIEDGLEIHHDSDLPARAGLGSSSSFAVGLLHALYTLLDKKVTKRQLALEAIHIERERLKENVGSQDQAAAAFGGLNVIEFAVDGHFAVRPVSIPEEIMRQLESHVMLFFTGHARSASEVAAEQVRLTPQKTKELNAMKAMVPQAESLLANRDLYSFGKLLHESWMTKRTLSSQITNSQIDEVYSAGLAAGALGGKLLGAGGGGFMMFFVPPEKQQKVRSALSKLLFVPVKFEPNGSEIIYRYSDSPSRPV